VFRDLASNTSTSTIRVGDTIRWNWTDPNLEHSSTSGACPPCSGDGTWDSGIRTAGSFTRVFSQAGTFQYFCIPHGTDMTGTVIVE
jgi:plastocyanin